MMKKTIKLLMVVTLFVAGCGSDTSSELLSQANFGSTLSSAIPAGLKADVAVTEVTPSSLSGTCLASYTDCPYVTASNGADSATGDILLRIWALDYNSECTSAMISSGTCFQIDTDSGTSSYIKPTLLSSPDSCATTSSSDIRAVNMGVDPCIFDTQIASISNYDSCKDQTGTEYDISAIIPWYATWGIPQDIAFTGFSGTSGAGMYWTINATGSKKYFVSIDDNWLYAGIKDTTNNEFMFMGTGSPDYYEGIGEDSGINLTAYAGDVPQNGVLGEFETIQIRSQGLHKYIERQIVNETHIWYQSWSTNFPTTAGAAESVKDSPDENRCLAIGASIATSKYVPFANCVTAFGKSSVSELNQDSNFILKIFDETTLNLIDFSTRLVTSSSACLGQ